MRLTREALDALFDEHLERRAHNSRVSEFEVDDLFIDRWSPRSFDPDYQVSDQTVATIIEAARWAPSSFNEQPWQFHLAKSGTSKFRLYLDLLDKGNLRWAHRASLLGYIVCKKYFDKSGEVNDCAEFDCGSAWMSLTLQARKLNLYTHGMAGFDREEAYKVLNLSPEKYKVICAFVIGAIADPFLLPPDLREFEKPNGRKPLSEIVK